MKHWLKKILKGEPTKDIIMSAIVIIVGFPGIILTFIGMFMDNSRLKDCGIICMVSLFISLAVWCISNKRLKATLGCSGIALLYIYILLAY